MTKRRADETPFEKLYKRLVAMVVTRLYSTAVTDGDDETRQAIITTASLLVSRRGDGYECGRDELLRILTDPKRGLDTKMVTRRVLHDNLVAHGFVKVETRHIVKTKDDRAPAKGRADRHTVPTTFFTMRPDQFTVATHNRVESLLRDLDSYHDSLAEERMLAETGGSTHKCEICPKAPTLTLFQACESRMNCSVCGSTLKTTWSIEQGARDRGDTIAKKVAVNKMYRDEIKPLLIKVEQQMASWKRARSVDAPKTEVEVVVAESVCAPAPSVVVAEDIKSLDDLEAALSSSSSSSSSSTAPVVPVFRVGDRLVRGDEVDEEEDPDEMDPDEYDRYYNWVVKGQKFLDAD